ncbi:MAG: hypothetical protein LH617_07615, partial [Ramlibacter sp.]|nr:hypothetical protein [Ramlibacter sp.]
MPIDWAAAAKWLAPKALDLARENLREREARDLQDGRNDHAGAAATEIVRMVLSGYTTADVSLSNLIEEFEGLLGRGA